MIIKSATFVKSATRPGNYPPADFKEVAFAGRSNVGKSSLINVLVNRRGLVRTSSTPGRTQLLNFFDINGEFYLVDLPGYGFAKVPMAVKKQWGPMVRTYLEGRDNLQALLLLFDIRRVPQQEEIQLLDWLEELQVPTIPIITKVDKITRSRRERQILPILEATGLPRDAFTLFSALSREGCDEVWQRIEAALDDEASPVYVDADD
ncbi:MAG: YihA family ribosome biogenesis GTP-binding protein [Desulfuromonadales bacterium C00003094]|nr:MAG: YihA family ribosome biogenesis GTP-binding protein [Desulfuromonadales bacterium C00003094]OEU74465.1 MAG: YihA family ribosome biogenesis GTP-binding protein [Desulfuromonadales bacterium C00003107]